MYKLRIENFQSIEKQELLLKGFVAFTGKSNLGKSAVRRAIGAVLFNDWDKSFSREGTNLPTIVQFSKESNDGTPIYDILMKKSDEHNDYTVTTSEGKQNFSKVGKTIPEAITNLGYKVLDMGDFTLNLTTTKQTDPLFIVSYKQATNTKILNRLFNISKLENASQLVQRDLRSTKIEQNKTIDLYNEKKNQLTEIIEQYESTVTLRDKVKTLIHKIELLTNYNSISSDVESKTKQLNSTLDDINNKLTLIDKLKSLQLLLTYNELLNQIKTLDSSRDESISAIDYLVKKLNKGKELLVKSENLVKIDSYKNIINNINSLETKFKELSKHDNFINNFAINRKVVNYIYQGQRIEAFTQQSSEKTKEIKELESFMVSINKLPLLSEYIAVVSNIETLSNKLSNISITELESQISALKEEQSKLMEVCPTCGQTIQKGDKHHD